MGKLAFFCFFCLINGLFISAKADSVTHAFEITKETCRALLNAQQGISADYQGGVDVYGNAVVGANLAPSPIQLPDVLTFPLTLDLAQRYDLPVGIGAEATVGELTLKDNRLYWNDQPLAQGPKDQIVEQCRDALSAE